MTALKPCPHCGSEAHFREVTADNENRGGEFIECENRQCGASSVLMFALMDDVRPLLAEKWNRRAVPQNMPPGIEGLVWAVAVGTNSQIGAIFDEHVQAHAFVAWLKQFLPPDATQEGYATLQAPRTA